MVTPPFFSAWYMSMWSINFATIRRAICVALAEAQSEVPGYTVTAYFSYGQYNLGFVHADDTTTGSNFDAAGAWIK